MNILVMNAGSSSIKSHIFAIDQSLPDTVPMPLWQAEADWSKEHGKINATINVNGQTVGERLDTASRADILHSLLETMWSGKTRVLNRPSDIAVVGHRVVHGGPKHHESRRITPEVKNEIKRLAAYAPLHNPLNLEGIEAIEHWRRDIPQVAVFDTAFHSHMPREAAMYPGPYAWFEQGIRRYGFHGTSHQYCARRSAQLLNRDLSSLRIITCHLGNGCSLTAIRSGQSIDTTMGFTPLEGVMMGTRSGTIDPSILLYLAREQGYTSERLELILNTASGLKGISGVSNDVRHIWKAADAGNERARLAMSIFIYRLRTFLGAMIAALGGVDVITFTGGIGENDARVRAGVCEALGFLNLNIDIQKNAASPVDQEISTLESAVRVLIVHTEEDWEIACECWKMMNNT